MSRSTARVLVCLIVAACALTSACGGEQPLTPVAPSDASGPTNTPAPQAPATPGQEPPPQSPTPPSPAPPSGNPPAPAPPAPSPTPQPPAPAPPPTPTPPPTGSMVRLSDDFGGRALFPSSNWWNQDISNAPVDPQSDAFIDFIGRARTLASRLRAAAVRHPLRRRRRQRAARAGRPSSTTAARATGFGGEPGYPIPEAAKTQPNFIEGGVPGGGATAIGTC